MSRFIYVFMSTQTSRHWRTIVIIKDVLIDCPALSMALENIKGVPHTQILQEHIFKIPFCFSQWVSIPIHQALSPGLMAFLHLPLFLPSGSSVLCSSDYWLSFPQTASSLWSCLTKKKKKEIGVTGILSADGDVCVWGGKEGPCGRFWFIFVSVKKKAGSFGSTKKCSLLFQYLAVLSPCCSYKRNFVQT